MNDGFELFLGAGCLLAAIAAISARRQVRSAVGFLLCVLFVASLSVHIGAPQLGWATLWFLGIGASLILFATLLLLNLSLDESGHRRFRFGPVVALMALAGFGGMFVGMVGGGSSPTAMTSSAMPPATRSMPSFAISFFTEQAFSVAALFLCMLATMLTTLVMVRRRG